MERRRKGLFGKGGSRDCFIEDLYIVGFSGVMEG